MSRSGSLIDRHLQGVKVKSIIDSVLEELPPVNDIIQSIRRELPRGSKVKFVNRDRAIYIECADTRLLMTRVIPFYESAYPEIEFIPEHLLEDKTSNTEE